MVNKLWNHIQSVRDNAPLVHNITNFVVMNNTANALLAAGASPIMAHAHPEVKDMVSICQALVINIGTLDEYFVKSMKMAAGQANALGKPWVLDPVGAGATPFRDEVLSELLALHPTVIRGNASEIMALAKANQTITKGVDSTAQSNEAIEAARFLQAIYGAVVCISGATDIVVGPEQTIFLKNGHPLMTKVTGLGCSSTAVIGAFIAVIPDKTEAVTAAMALFSLAGERAAQTAAGPSSLQMQLLDELYALTETDFKQQINISLHA
ncbi:hydroxyethylthiazole kinase [Arsenicibacter rosenii]|uniref:Hydroxyethylthiazole kinase n=1 Tax=Arsenicibacter rosenii TaxID=1750698 RepID=A0A1S2VLE3_9BACT|nr:hydroxyethylthiazole kinase [Arsenicibacter rosenii]OIN59597.1 hydroxyethylthiazole kinase [Arsenicibacter rosenii]